MSIEILLGAAMSGLVGLLLAIPAIVVEVRHRRQQLPIVLEIRWLWTSKLTDREVFVISLLFHLLLATLVGGFYAWFAEHGWLLVTHAPYALRSVLLFTVGTWLIAGAIIYPLLGMGWFAAKERKHMWFEMLITHVLIGFGFWLGVHFYQPYFF